MANLFTKFFDSIGFSKLASTLNRSANDQSVLAVDLGSSSIKVTQLRREQGKILLETYGELAVAPYGSLAVGQSVNLNQEKLAEALSDIMKEANVTAKQAVFSIPSKASLIVNIEIPEAAKADLASIVPLEARKFVPVPITEVALDWWVIPELPDRDSSPTEKSPVKMMEVLVVAIHKDTVRQYQEVAKKIGVELKTFEIETFSAIRAAMRNDLSATAILDLGASSSKMTIVDYGVVRMAHTINKGAQDVTLTIARSLNVPFDKAEEIKRKVGLVEPLDENVMKTMNSVIEYIFTEANRVISVYQKKNHRAVDKLILIGGGAMLRGLMTLATNSFEVPVYLGRPFERVEYPAFLDGVLRDAGPVFAVSLGLGLRQIEEN